jgi:hypothetical protein
MLLQPTSIATQQNFQASRNVARADSDLDVLGVGETGIGTGPSVEPRHYSVES